MSVPTDSSHTPQLVRRLGLLQATALNMSNMIGVGPFITIPLLMTALGGPQALLGWLVALVIVAADGLVWSELGAALPGSGGTYHYLREAFGPATWGRLMAFLFIWQFILSGPLEIASGYIGFANYVRYVWRDMSSTTAIAVAVVAGVANIALLYRRIESIGALTVTLWIGTLLTTVVVIVSGAFHFNPGRGVRLSARRVHDLDGVSARPGRGCPHRHLRLPRLLRRLLHRRRGQRAPARHPALDPDQRVCRGADLCRDQPVGHRRRALARVRARSAHPESDFIVSIFMERLYGSRVASAVHDPRVVDGVRVGVRAAPRLLAEFRTPPRSTARSSECSAACIPPSAFRTSRSW